MLARGVQAFNSGSARIHSAVTDDFRRLAPQETEVFTLHDGLSVGPLMPIVDIESWQAKRLAYWRSLIGLVDSDTLPRQGELPRVPIGTLVCIERQAGIKLR